MIVLSKNPSNGKQNNKKQQKQQQQGISVSPFVSGNPRKNPKNQNKNSNKNNKNSRTTTVRPKLFQTTSFGFQNKSRKYDFNGFIAGLKVTTVRPKSYINNNVDPKIEKYIYEKAPVKAPKQVKENGYTTQRTTSSDTEIFDRIHTINPNIPKLFQKYDKIQEVYPEFHPYVGPKNPTRSPFSGSNNGKPSRENSKSLFFAESPYAQESALTSLKKSSSGLSSQQLRTPNSRLQQSQSIGRG